MAVGHMEDVLALWSGYVFLFLMFGFPMMVVIDSVREGALKLRPAADRVTRWAGHVALWWGLILMSLSSLATTEWQGWWPWRLLIIMLTVGLLLVLLEIRHRRVNSPVRASKAPAQRTPGSRHGPARDRVDLYGDHDD